MEMVITHEIHDCVIDFKRNTKTKIDSQILTRTVISEEENSEHSRKISIACI